MLKYEHTYFLNITEFMPQKKKILHIIQSLDNGGCENMLLRTLPLLDGFQHKIITLKEFGELTPAFVSAGIEVKTIHCDHLFDIPGIRRLRRLIREEKTDIIITYLFHADMLGRLALYDVTESPIIPFLRTTYNHPKYLVARILEWCTKSLVKRYLANSEAVKNFYINHIGIPPEKITVIPNGIDISVYENASGSKIIRKLNLPDHRFVITCVANLASNKGHRYLLEAFESVFQQHPEAYLLLVGDGPERRNLENQIKKYQSKNNIFFLGRRTDVPDILKASDCFVLPTLFEGMSNAILEAMAAGLPVITTDIPENRMLLEKSSTGFLIEPKDETSLALSILNIIKDQSLAEKLSKNAHLIVQKKYSLQSTAKLWVNFFSIL